MVQATRLHIELARYKMADGSGYETRSSLGQGVLRSYVRA